MSVKPSTEPVPALEPVAPSSPPAPGANATAIFLPSAELGEQLRQLQKAQAEIDRRQAEQLARLRDIQDRD
jgi:hypothetical protein